MSYSIETRYLAAAIYDQCGSSLKTSAVLKKLYSKSVSERIIRYWVSGGLIEEFIAARDSEDCDICNSIGEVEIEAHSIQEDIFKITDEMRESPVYKHVQSMVDAEKEMSNADFSAMGTPDKPTEGRTLFDYNTAVHGKGTILDPNIPPEDKVRGFSSYVPVECESHGTVIVNGVKMDLNSPLGFIDPIAPADPKKERFCTGRLDADNIHTGSFSVEMDVNEDAIKKLLKPTRNRFEKDYSSQETIVGIIGDTHLPYEHPDYLQWVIHTFVREGVNRIIHIGDLFDFHDASFHDSETSLMGHNGERILAKERLKPWIDAFPELTLIHGNHDKIPSRHMKKMGLDPNVFMRPLGEVMGFPSGWNEVDSITIDEVLYHHGMTACGQNGFRLDAQKRMCNTVTGHAHSNLGVSFTACQAKAVWGLAVGCGIDIKSHAFAYDKDFKNRPILGCGVVKGGHLPQAFAMPL